MTGCKRWDDDDQYPQAAVDNRPKIYVASRASNPERPQMWRNLRATGARIISTWIDESGSGLSNYTELWVRIVNEIRSCDRLVFYAEPQDLPVKGALVEVGIALALNIPVCVLGKHIELERATFRPIGSWVAHPGVILANTNCSAELLHRALTSERI